MLYISSPKLEKIRKEKRFFNIYVSRIERKLFNMIRKKKVAECRFITLGPIMSDKEKLFNIMNNYLEQFGAHVKKCKCPLFYLTTFKRENCIR